MVESPESWWSKDTVAVVTGANKGIGLEIARQFALKGLSVVLTARDEARGLAAVDVLKSEGLETVCFHQLDVTNEKSIQKLATWLKQAYGGIDILVNNAGAVGSQFDYETAKLVVMTNYYGTVEVTSALLPLLRASPTGARIVNVTSRLGLYERFTEESLRKQFREEKNYSKEFADAMATKYLQDVEAGQHGEKGWIVPMERVPMYSESKVFMNVYAAALAKSLWKSQPAGHQIFVTSMCPGTTETDLFGSANAAGFEIPPGFSLKTVANGADTAVWLALLPKEELIVKNGKLFGEREEYAFGAQLGI